MEPDFAGTQRKPLVLDKDQRTLAETREHLRAFVVSRDRPGSGKIAGVGRSRGKNLPAKESRFLIVTFNITLWHYLRDLIVRGASRGGWMNRITFVHFHDWCKRNCQSARIPQQVRRGLWLLSIRSRTMTASDDKEKKRQISLDQWPLS